MVQTFLFVLVANHNNTNKQEKEKVCPAHAYWRVQHMDHPLQEEKKSSGSERKHSSRAPVDS